MLILPVTKRRLVPVGGNKASEAAKLRYEEPSCAMAHGLLVAAVADRLANSGRFR